MGALGREQGGAAGDRAQPTRRRWSGDRGPGWMGRWEPARGGPWAPRSDDAPSPSGPSSLRVTARGARRAGGRRPTTGGPQRQEVTASRPRRRGGNICRQSHARRPACHAQNWTIWLPSPSRPTVVTSANIRRSVPRPIAGPITLREEQVRKERCRRSSIRGQINRPTTRVLASESLIVRGFLMIFREALCRHRDQRDLTLSGTVMTQPGRYQQPAGPGRGQAVTAQKCLRVAMPAPVADVATGGRVRQPARASGREGSQVCFRATVRSEARCRHCYAARPMRRHRQ